MKRDTQKDQFTSQWEKQNGFVTIGKLTYTIDSHQAILNSGGLEKQDNPLTLMATDSNTNTRI